MEYDLPEHIRLPYGLDAIERYIKSRKLFWSPSTQEVVGYKLSHMLKLPYGDPMKLIQALKEEGKGLNTIRNYLENWKGFDRWLNHGFTPYDAFMRQKGRSFFRNCYQDKTKHITLDHFKEVLKKAAQKEDGLYNMVVLMGMCGLRRSEALNAKWSDIQDDVIEVVGKGNKLRRVPIDKTLLIKLERTEKIVGDNVGYHRFFYREDLGCTPHDLRSFFATSLAIKVTPFELMNLLGHTDLNTTSKYVRRNLTQVKEKMNGFYEGIFGTFRPNDRSGRKKYTGR